MNLPDGPIGALMALLSVELGLFLLNLSIRVQLIAQKAEQGVVYRYATVHGNDQWRTLSRLGLRLD